MSFIEALTIIGGLTVLFHLLKLAWKCWRGLRNFVLSEIWHVDFRAYGQWAVITGATSGIGKAYAHELARRGLDVVLVSRSEDKLQMVAKEIEDHYGRKTRTIQVDFTDGHRIYAVIAKALRGLEIGILVNNVGMNYCDHLASFLDVPDMEQKITQVVNCNVLSVPQMTRLVLPDMIKRGTGLIINMSSLVGEHPQPLLSLYSATKIFVTYFSRCLHAEYQSKGITVQCVAPFMVSTDMTHNIEVSSFVKSASDFAREALNTVGHSSYTTGCLSHALQDAALTALVPEWLRLSPFFIRKLQNSEKMWEHKFKWEENEKLRGKEE
ncbi:very-long-chain 3-oxoacyl-CoA reductase-like [Solea senegalensis]|uniref:Very-long-chain 3-oxoacyl-CoA reductase-like n=1 Tax=Solea senegalensis TaxID=28829 RepID=A0AAV6SF68_SOLSE|nr:hydroxysteroid (20-beta) dehydrogenase 2 [Solea senegalensis]KAG7515475.1 very-long-chain 3-oxoacyl-CoA reductase-like [Solea senegalensis]